VSAQPDADDTHALRYGFYALLHGAGYLSLALVAQPMTALHWLAYRG
jgi:hypothetical protein